tara:strand:+ start:135 stop:269 length:135 start_codon:yes stop_codon:yes gene_type:complete
MLADKHIALNESLVDHEGGDSDGKLDLDHFNPDDDMRFGVNGSE